LGKINPLKIYLIRRLIQDIPVLALIGGRVFFLTRSIPGDPALFLLGESSEPGEFEAIRQEMGLDKPIYFPFLIWLSKIKRGDFGRAITY
jgi:peptide/nickel transport system permease protein